VKRLPSAARQSQIRQRLAERPGVAVSDLARAFGVSGMTIRRDLAALEAKAHVQRTHGGAVLAERMILEFDYRERRETNRAAKRAIAAAARRLVRPGQRLILDNGTTSLELAALLQDGEDLTVITPSLAVASELQHAAGVEVILLGGVMRRGSPDLTGPVTEHCLELFSADFAFQGADGIGDDGTIYNTDLRLARVDRMMRRLAGEAACSPTTRRSAPPPSPAAARWPTSTSSSPAPAPRRRRSSASPVSDPRSSSRGPEPPAPHRPSRLPPLLPFSP
jgi:DeoR family fructose operon transcriptional repressor